MKKFNCNYCNFGSNTKNHMSIHIFNHAEINMEDRVLSLMKLLYGFDEEIMKKIILEYKNGTSSNFLSKQYNISNDILRNVFTKLNIPIRNGKEAHSCEHYKKIHKKTIEEKYGVENVSQLQEVKEKKQKTLEDKYGVKNSYQLPHIRKKAKKTLQSHSLDKTKEIGNKIKEFFLKKYGVENVAQLPEIKSKNSFSAKKRLEKLTKEQLFELTKKARNNIKNISKTEQKIQSILNSHLIEYSSNKPIERYICDIVFPNKKILEIQGDFWHCSPIKYKADDIVNFPGGIKVTASDIWKKDLKKKRRLETIGYKVFYLWEYQINSLTDDELLQIIKNEIA